jgi:hypothetical protein
MTQEKIVMKAIVVMDQAAGTARMELASELPSSSRLVAKIR